MLICRTAEQGKAAEGRERRAMLSVCAPCPPTPAPPAQQAQCQHSHPGAAARGQLLRCSPSSRDTHAVTPAQGHPQASGSGHKQDNTTASTSRGRCKTSVKSLPSLCTQEVCIKGRDETRRLIKNYIYFCLQQIS